MPKMSAGLLLFRRTAGEPEVLLVHPGGPFWAKKDAGAWSVPKGMAEEGEELWIAAQREFTEETGFAVPQGERIELGSVTYSNKKVHVWAIESDANASAVRSKTITMPFAGKMVTFPECDQAGWYTFDAARQKMVRGQTPFIDRLATHVYK